MTDWKKTIRDDGKIDLSGIPLYDIKFTTLSKKINVYGYDIILPEAPKDEDCINYKLPINDQIWRRVFIPPDLKRWHTKDRELFIRDEHHRRHNGVWIFIKGEKFYIPGPFYFFLTYWTSMTADNLIYRYTDWEFFIMWLHICYDPKCYGLLDDKCRQAGDTEKAICIIYEYTTRVRGVKAAMQSINEDDIFDNAYTRILHAHGEMVFYMRATNRGTSDPKDGLIFDYQRETLSKGKMLKNQTEHGIAQITYDEYEHQPLNSAILYGATKPHVFGTGTYGRYYNDEHGKWQLADPLYTWNVVKQAMYNKITNNILGKAIFTSTVEELSGGETLKTAKKFWNQSDPEKRNSNGETLTGLYRIFRGALDCAPPDRWGFPQKELALEKIKSDLAAYMAVGDIKGMIEYKRMNAITIEDVFLTTNEGSQFDVEKLQRRLYYIQNDAPKSLYVKGNLVWKDGVRDSVVVWEPNSKGKWIISKHPSDFGLKQNAIINGIVAPKPANTTRFCTGIDPIDQKSVLESDPSLGGICVFAKLDEYIDGGEEKYYQFDDPEQGIRKGDPVNGGFDFITNRVCCTYVQRPNDPMEFFEDVILTLRYYGSDALIEKNRQHALVTYLSTRNYDLYKMERPTTFKNYRGQQERDGVSATEGNIDAYFTFLTTLSCKWWNTIDHPDLLEQLLSMNYANKGKKDLGVACGWALFAATIPTSRKAFIEQSEIIHYHENYV
jgi:hypothetical protein